MHNAEEDKEESHEENTEWHHKAESPQDVEPFSFLHVIVKTPMKF